MFHCTSEAGVDIMSEVLPTQVVLMPQVTLMVIMVGSLGRGSHGIGGRGRDGRFVPYPSQVVIMLYSYLIIYI